MTFQCNKLQAGSVGKVFGYFLVSVLFLVGRPLWAGDTVNVYCDAVGPVSPPDFLTVQAAINSLDPSVTGHKVVITGTCVEGVAIRGFSGLTLTGSDVTTASINDPDLTQCLRINALRITASDEVTVEHLTLSGEQTFVSRSSVVFEDVEIEDSCDTGLVVVEGSNVEIRDADIVRSQEEAVFVSASRFFMDGIIAIQDNGGDGLSISQGSFVQARLNAPESLTIGKTVPGPGVGIRISDLSTVSLRGEVGAGNLTISDHQAGIVVNDGSVLDLRGATIENNSGGNVPAGLRIVRGGIVTMNGITVESNGGPGILLDLGAIVQLINSTIQNNTADGIDIRNLSIVRSVIGNTGLNNLNSDITCDATSVLTGDWTGFSNVKCAGKTK